MLFSLLLNQIKKKKKANKQQILFNLFMELTLLYYMSIIKQTFFALKP